MGKTKCLNNYTTGRIEKEGRTAETALGGPENHHGSGSLSRTWPNSEWPRPDQEAHV